MKKLLTLITLCMALAAPSFAQEEEDYPAVPERGGEGIVNILIEPAGSTVYLDGQEIGKSPIKNLKFISGRHDLLVIDQEQELLNTRFNVWADSVNTYNGKTVMPYGNIKVTTNPKKCIIYLDGDRLDYTDGGSLTINRIRVGTHIVEAKCGRKRVDATVEVLGEQTVEILLDSKKRK